MEIRGSAGYEIRDVETADSRWARFRGLMLARPRPLLMETRSVHGFWLRSSLWVVGVAPDGTVTGVVWLRRRRIARLRRARWVLELPPGSPLPAEGERLAFRLPQYEASSHGGSTLPVRHSHRQSG